MATPTPYRVLLSPESSVGGNHTVTSARVHMLTHLEGVVSRDPGTGATVDTAAQPARR